MASKLNELPWENLTGNLEWRTENACTTYSTNYHFRFKSNQNESLQSFVDAMVSAIEESADHEISKYLDTHGSPSPEDVVIDDDAAQRIAPLIRRWRNDSFDWKCDELASTIPCQHRDDYDCKCVLPLKERKMSAFLREFKAESRISSSDEGNRCPFGSEINKRVLFNLEVFKTLVICGEMKSLLRIFSNPYTHLYSWWDDRSCNCQSPGGCCDWCQKPDDNNWALIATNSLKSLVTLNSMSRLTQHGHGEHDYRSTEAYQEMVFDGTRYMECPLIQYQHRLFFGITDGQFHQWGGVRGGSKWNRVLDLHRIDVLNFRPPLGYTLAEDFLDCQGGKAPDEALHTLSDILKVRSDLLNHTRLPGELVDIILTQGEYDIPRRTLPVSNDPLHPRNHQQLQEYIKECWELLTRCEVLIRVLNATMCRAAERGRPHVDAAEEVHGIQVTALRAGWRPKIQHVIANLFGCACCSEMLNKGEDLGFISDADLGHNAAVARYHSRLLIGP